MRLALVTHNITAGDGQGLVSLELARRAHRAGIEVSMFADRVDTELLDEGVRWVPVHPRPRRPVLIKVPRFATLATQQLHARAGEFDVIHAHGYTLGLPHHVNTAHYVHGSWIREPTGVPGIRGLYQRVYTHLNAAWERPAFDAARVVVAVSQRVQDELEAIQVRPDRIRIISNGVESSPFPGSPPARSELGLPEGACLALFAGDLRSSRKNLDGALRALQLVPGVHLAVAGAVHGSPYPKLAQQLNLLDRVHFLGFRTDLPLLMRSADMFLCPSRYEPFSLVLMEALAAGLPVITNRRVGAAELLAPDCACVLPGPDDVKGMGAAMMALRDDAGLRSRMGAAGIALARRYHWDRMVEEYLRLYAEVSN